MHPVDTEDAQRELTKPGLVGAYVFQKTADGDAAASSAVSVKIVAAWIS
jgi:hypothetical protein